MSLEEIECIIIDISVIFEPEHEAIAKAVHAFHIRKLRGKK